MRKAKRAHREIANLADRLRLRNTAAEAESVPRGPLTVTASTLPNRHWTRNDAKGVRA